MASSSHPGPTGSGGGNRTPPVKGVGEPCAGEPHARFDGRGLETERYGVTAPAPDPTNLIYVDPQHWGQGVGRLLMTAARDRLRGDGAREALLWVFAGNDRARRFYEIDGWRADGLAVRRPSANRLWRKC